MDAKGTGAADGPGVGQVRRYKPRRPQASPLYRLVQDHFRMLEIVYDERFAPRYGAWRAVVREVADKFLACGILDHGFARVRCATCAHEYLLAFSCKGRYFCPSCHAKRLTLWTLWLEETLLAHDTAALTRAFLARVVTHIPNKHQVMTRYYGWYANRSRDPSLQAGAWSARPTSLVLHVTLRHAPPLSETRGCRTMS